MTAGPQVRAPRVETSGGATLEVDGVTKRYGSADALRGVTLHMLPGECVTLLGPSGSGKSTLLKIIAGFETATDGRVSFDGREISRLPPSARGTGMVFQNYALFPHMTVAGNVAYGLKLRRWSPARRRERVAQMLELVGLMGFEGRYPRELSGGQQQRVAIARALAYDPPLLLMDEPLGALDRALRLEMVEQIRGIHRELETTIMYVTHDQQEALALSDRIAILRDGLIVEFGPPETLYRRPRSEFVARFFGGANLFAATVLERHGDGTARIDCSGTEVDGVAGAEDGTALAVRPRSLCRGEPEGRALRISGSVVDAMLLGDEREVSVDAGALGRVRAVLPAQPSDGIDVGSHLELYARLEELVLVAGGGEG